MVIIFIISYSRNLFVVLFLYMCIIFISLYNVYIGKLTFNQLLYQAVINNQLLAIGYLLSTTGYLLSATGYLLSVEPNRALESARLS